jgi:hypothetical protein
VDTAESSSHRCVYVDLIYISLMNEVLNLLHEEGRVYSFTSNIMLVIVTQEVDGNRLCV